MSLSQDVRFSARLLARDRGTTLIAVLVLALGIAVCNTAFTMLTGMFLRPIPIPGVDRLVYLEAWTPGIGRGGFALSEIEEGLNGTKSLGDLAFYRLAPANVAEANHQPVQLQAMWTTPNVFRLIGQRAAVGRDLPPHASTGPREPVALISSRLWRTRYGSAADVLGRSLTVEGVPATIIGVMPDGMDFDHRRDLWLTIGDASERGRGEARDFLVMGRLKDGVTLGQARAEMATRAAALARGRGRADADVLLRVTPFSDRILGSEQRTAYTVLAIAVAFVLLISCGNVANLLLARSGHRAPEMALRLALGAGRWAIVRQMLTESVLVGLAGGTLGLGLSYAGVSWLRGFLDAAPDRPFWVDIAFDAPVFLFLAGVSTAAGLVSGIAPAVLASGVRLTEALQEKGHGATGSLRARRLTRLMIVGQLAMTLVLLTGAGLLIRTFVKMYQVEVGVETPRILTAQVRIATSAYPTAAARREFFDRFEARLAAAPGVRGVSIADAAPLEHRALRSVEIEGAAPNRSVGRAVVVVHAGSRYFDALGVRLRRGRGFAPPDGEPGHEVAIISERLARAIPGGDPIGRRIRLSEREGQPAAGPEVTIVGVAPEIRQNPAFWPLVASVVYLPFRANPTAEAVVIAGGRGEGTALAPLLRQRVREVDADLPLYEVMTLDDRVRLWSGPFRVLGSVFGFLGLMGLLMAAAGMYATVAWTVQRRRRESGIRLSLGASPGQVAWLFARQALRDAGAGLALGLLASLAVGFVLRSIILTSPFDLPTLAAGSGILILATLLAVWQPLRRAARLDPISVLRVE